jgi:hypothetical protein
MACANDFNNEPPEISVIMETFCFITQKNNLDVKLKIKQINSHVKVHNETYEFTYLDIIRPDMYIDKKINTMTCRKSIDLLNILKTKFNRNSKYCRINRYNNQVRMLKLKELEKQHNQGASSQTTTTHVSALIPITPASIAYAPVSIAPAPVPGLIPITPASIAPLPVHAPVSGLIPITPASIAPLPVHAPVPGLIPITPASIAPLPVHAPVHAPVSGLIPITPASIAPLPVHAPVHAPVSGLITPASIAHARLPVPITPASIEPVPVHARVPGLITPASIAHARLPVPITPASIAPVPVHARVPGLIPITPASIAPARLPVPITPASIAPAPVLNSNMFDLTGPNFTIPNVPIVIPYELLKHYDSKYNKMLKYMNDVHDFLMQTLPDNDQKKMIINKIKSIYRQIYQ